MKKTAISPSSSSKKASKAATTQARASTSAASTSGRAGGALRTTSRSASADNRATRPRSNSNSLKTRDVVPSAAVMQDQGMNFAGDVSTDDDDYTDDASTVRGKQKSVDFCTGTDSAEHPTALVSNRLEPLGSSDEGCGWETVTNKKPADRRRYLYIRNLRQDVSIEGLSSYIRGSAEKAGVRATVYADTHKFFDKGTHTAARVAVDASAADLIKSREFWPRSLYARDWDFDLYDKKESQNIAAGKITGASDVLKRPPSADQVAATPRGKSRGHEVLTPPTQPDAKKATTTQDLPCCPQKGTCNCARDDRPAFARRTGPRPEQCGI